MLVANEPGSLCPRCETIHQGVRRRDCIASLKKALVVAKIQKCDHLESRPPSSSITQPVSWTVSSESSVVAVE